MKNFPELIKMCHKVFVDNAPNPKTRGVGYYRNAYGNWQRKSTGNLAFNASKVRFISKRKAIIYVDENIAPYMPYTNEIWKSPKWKGHKNPNYQWFNKTYTKIAHFIAKTLHGKIV